MKTLIPGVPDHDQLNGGAETEDPAPISSGNALSQHLYALIAQQPFLKGLSVHQLQVLAASAMEIQFGSGQLILTQGEPANRFYLILGGKIVLESDVKGRGPVRIRTVGPGEDLGWSWLFPPDYVHFSARAIEPVSAIFFYGTRLRQQCDEDHDLGYELMKRIAEVVIQNVDAMQQRLMKCTDAENPSS